MDGPAVLPTQDLETHAITVTPSQPTFQTLIVELIVKILCFCGIPGVLATSQVYACFFLLYYAKSPPDV